jgi:octopine/nopaline transport system substrate-binding protein
MRQHHAAFATAKDSPLANAAGTGATIKMTPGQTGVKEVDALKAAFKGKTIGIQAATVYAKFVYDNFGDIAQIREYKTGAERDLDLQSGRIDLGFDDAVYFSSAFEAAKDTLAFTGPEIAGSIWGERRRPWHSQADTELRDKFNEGDQVGPCRRHRQDPVDEVVQGRRSALAISSAAGTLAADQVSGFRAGLPHAI